MQLPRSGIRTAGAISLLLVLISGSVSQAKTPELFTQGSVDAAALAKAVNHFVALGETRATQELMSLDPNHSYGVGWVCRVLFSPKNHRPLRPPAYGVLMTFADLSIPDRDSPLFPVAASGNSYFVLGDAYLLGGWPEDPKHYVAYCSAEGTFRTKPVPVPTRAQAQQDTFLLRQSPAWRAIKWRDRGPRSKSELDEIRTWEFIKRQADSIK